jgi:organic hydroperoxide reductase OsmC/OhrA
VTENHLYRTTVRWTGNLGTGTSGYREYHRKHVIEAPSKPVLLGSSDPQFHGDADRYNPEELLVASLSACHMLWYLHLCANAGVVVVDYVDQADGVMETDADGSGRFTEVTLHPHVTIVNGSPNVARELHDTAHRMCFIANSVQFSVKHEPVIVSCEGGGSGSHRSSAHRVGPAEER